MCDENSPAGLNHWTSGPLLAGPMVGEVGTTDAFIWVQARDASPLTLTIKPETSGDVTDFHATPAASDGFCVTFHVTGLTAATRYIYFVSSIAHGSTYPEGKLFHTAPNHSARKAKIAFGSCFKFYGSGSGETPAQGKARDALFHNLAYQQPDVFVMAGDACYYNEADRESEWTMLCAQLRTRNTDAMREVLPFVSTLAVWDDHDYGPNNSDATYAPHNHDRSRPTFMRMWAQRTWGQNDQGIYSTVRWGPVEIFLLDGRYFRDKTGATRSVLGAAQLDWLKQKLSASDAAVKLLVSTTVVLPEFIGHIVSDQWEGWQTDGLHDRDEVLLPYIEQHDIKGVVFLSGDLHLGFLCRRRARDLGNGKLGPVFWELVSSPLANDNWSPDGVIMDANPFYDRQVLRELARPNFGVIDIDLDRDGAEVELSLQQHTTSGGTEHVTTAFTESIALSSLRTRTQALPLRAVSWSNGKAYFFRGNRYARYTIASVGDVQHADAGYPKTLTDQWPDLPSSFRSGVDAGYAWLGKAYLFCGNGYVRYSADPLYWNADPPEWTADAGYPKYIKLQWPGFWDWDFDAVVPWPNGFVYFFRGTQYLRCKLGEHQADGAPKDIKGNWPGLAEAFPHGIDAGVVWTSGHAYFFRGDHFVRYKTDPAHEGVDGSIKSIADWWPTLATL